MMRNILYYHNMQYQVDPTDQTPDNGQKPHFLPIFAYLMLIMHTQLIMHDLLSLLSPQKRFYLS